MAHNDEFDDVQLS